MSTLDELPLSIQDLVNYAINKISPDKIILFGSQATGTSHEKSDYDIAFVTKHHQAWLEFVTEVDELPITLLPVDLVLYDAAPVKLKHSIETSGITLYEKR